MSVFDIIKERRTIRRFKPDEIKPCELEKILEAGLWAPSAGGRQSTIMLVSTDKEANLRLGRINRDIFGGALKVNTHSVNQNQLSIADDDSIKNGFYDAPVIVTLLTPEGFGYAPNDATATAQNMMLTAWELGIGCVYVGRAPETYKTDEGKAFLKKANIPDGYEAQTTLCFGYPANESGEGKARKEGRIFHLKP